MDTRRAIPAVERLLSSEEFAPLLRASPRPLVIDAVQRVQSEVRSRLISPNASSHDEETDARWYAARVAEVLARVERPSLRPVINATGVMLHTNLGRAPLADAATAAMLRIATSYSNLEYDLDAGARGSRYVHCAALLRELTGAEDALVVNNNAAALVLALNTHALAGDAVISRGELVEIGGSFRVPEIMERSGARMCEVGATNRVYLSDYEAAVTDETRAILKVHPSNFRISGFTSEVGLDELSRLAGALGIPLIADLGSGLMIDPAQLGLPHEPTGSEALRAGADIVTMSGDKLLGGPQAGIVLGRKRYLDAMRKNPLCRALRVDKLTLAALEATLVLYRDPPRALREIPVLAMLAASPESLRERAGALVARLRAAGIDADSTDGSSAVGGGAYPDVELPTTLVLLPESSSADRREAALRAAETPVVARIIEDRVALDLRTVSPAEEDALFATICRVCA
jgi:L-seryl-tRNA(Ser) seleniumtransferase